MASYLSENDLSSLIDCSIMLTEAIDRKSSSKVHYNIGKKEAEKLLDKSRQFVYIPEIREMMSRVKKLYDLE